MSNVAFTLYKGFLIAEYSEADVRAYRSRGFYADNVTSYVSSDQAYINQMIDVAGDKGDFTELEYNILMKDLGRTGYVPDEGIEPAYPRYLNYIMDMVRQHLGLEEGDTSRDAEINLMSPDTVFGHVLEWEGIIGYNYTIPGWIKDIYGVDLSLAEGFKHPQ